MPNSVVENSSNQFGSFSGRRRWLICALLFFAATVNYMDRQVIALLKPTLQVQFGWTDVDYSNIVLIFQFAYGAGVLFVGKLIDRMGTRKGFSLAVFVWSVAAMAHAAAASIFQFAAARFFLGLGEAGSFPASVKAVAEWFPKKQRALATGVFNSGANIGASRKTALLVCALAVTPIMLAASTPNAWLAVLLIALAAGAHQGWSANIYTLASDMFPRNAVASVVGFATMAGTISGMLIAKAVGYTLQSTGSYMPVFVLAGLAYLVALAFVQALAPRLKPVQSDVQAHPVR